MISAALSGFALSLSLILAIGAQNSFVIRQGLLNQHVLAVVLFCGLSDMLLICLGVLGLGQLLAPVFDLYGAWQIIDFATAFVMVLFAALLLTQITG